MLRDNDGHAVKNWSVPTIVLIVAVAMKTALLIADAHVYGRLAIPPVYDDVSYFYDALTHVDEFQAGGLRAVINGLIASPPHAPYSTLSALLGFLISGNSVTSPYVMNAVAIFFLTLVWIRMFKAALFTCVSIAICLVSNAWFDNAVMIFHPDLIAGYGSAIVASILLFRHLTMETLVRQVSLGVLAGLVLLTKPTALPAVIILWVAALFFGIVASRWAGQSVSKISWSTLIALVVMLIVSGSYYYATLQDHINYIYSNFFVTIDSQKKIYESIYGKSNKYFFFVGLARSFFGWWSWLGFGVVAIVSVGAAVTRRPILIGMIGLLICIVISDAVPSMSAVRVMLFGSLFYGMLVVAFFTSLHLLQRFGDGAAGQTSGGSRALLRSAGAIAMVAVIVTAAEETKDGQVRFPPSLLRWETAEYDAVYAILSAQADLATQTTSAPPALAVLFPTSSPIPPTDYGFRGLQHGITFKIDAADFETDMDRLVGRARAANVTVVPDEKALADLPAFPVLPIIPELVRRLRADPGFEELHPVDMSKGQILAFRRK